MAASSLLRGWSPGGPAPLAEALVELLRWLRGDAVGFGDTSHAAPGIPLPSAPGTRADGDPSTYRSPFDHACRPLLADFMSKIDTDVIGKGMGSDNGVDNIELIAVNDAIRRHPVETVGKTLRGYMTAMKRIV